MSARMPRRGGATGRVSCAVHAPWVACVFTFALAVAPVVAQTAPARRGTTRPVTQRAAIPGAATADTTAGASTLRAGSVVRPDTVAVGDPFTLVVTVEVPVEATVQWPSITDTAAVVAMRAPARVTSQTTGATRRETAEYTLTAWDVGALPVGLPDATVRTSAGMRTVPLRDARVVVRSVLPGDTSLRVPKPARALFPRVVPWWEAWWPAAAVVAALGLLWWVWHRRRHRVVQRLAAPVDVFARAMHDFDRLHRLALADLGERGRAVALAVEILRTYLSARAPAAVLSRTSAELLEAIGADARVPTDRLASLLAEADSIKFAHRAVSNVRARELQEEARALVEVVEQAEQARRKREEAARLANERAERDAEQSARKAADDDARRRARRPKAGAR